MLIEDFKGDISYCKGIIISYIIIIQTILISYGKHDLLQSISRHTTNSLRTEMVLIVEGFVCPVTI